MPVALDEGVPDEEVAGELGVDPPEPDDAADDERHAVERDPLGRDGRAALARPARLGVLPLHEVLAELLGPHRVDARVDPGPQPARLDELLGHDELRLLAEERRPGTDAEARAAGAGILPLLLVADADVREQAGEQRLVDRVGVDLALADVRTLPAADVEPGLLGGLPDLAVEVLPLADAQVVEELRLAHPAEGAAS